jgi:hypothetical protein
MTDTLLQNLTELTSPAATDLLYMVADPTGTPLDRKVQFSTVLDRAKGYSTILDASGKGDYTDLAAALEPAKPPAPEPPTVTELTENDAQG